jgi:antibiotic biosynthesis monooxygenase (ABM) superfamily enzyme
MLASRPRLWTARLATTLAAWLIAFAVVTSLLNVFGHQLSAMSPTLRALVISGTLVVLMVNVVMPFLSVRISRWFR